MSQLKQIDSQLTQFSQYQRVGVFVDVQNMFYSAKRRQEYIEQY